MNSRKLIALFMAFALTGGAMAAHTVSNDGSGIAEDVTVVQQHTVFVEIIMEDRDDDDGDGDDANEIHEFGAVAGLIEECEADEGGGGGGGSEVFDNAVLWFNDQFLFGNKSVDATSPSPPSDACVVPSGWAMGIGSGPLSTVEDPSVNTTDPRQSEALPVKDLIGLDNQCNGCIFEYEATFYFTDPNGNSWMVDKLVYPVSLNGDLFASGGGADCHDGSGVVGNEDPRSPGVHADECQDSSGTGQDNHNNAGGQSDSSGDQLVEPIYVTHQQVQDTFVSGEAALPLDDATLTNYGDHLEATLTGYTFVLTVDFAAFEDHPWGTGAYDNEGETHEDPTRSASANGTLNGDSHPENANTADAGPDHLHSTVNLDIFFDELAPYFVETNNAWDSDSGAPPAVNDDCSDDANNSGNPNIQNRAVMVCDTTQDDGSHAHDGSETIRPIN